MGLIEDIFAQVGQSGATRGGQPQPGQAGGGNGQSPLVVALQELLKCTAPAAPDARDAAPQSVPRNVVPAPGASDGASAQGTDLINGLNGILQKLQDAGLGDVIRTWIGTGENAPVAPKDLKTALGQDTVRKAADQAGIKSDDFLTQLARTLPGLIDSLTPNGRLPSSQEVSDMVQRRR